jgi:hypothetical protein
VTAWRVRDSFAVLLLLSVSVYVFPIRLKNICALLLSEGISLPEEKHVVKLGTEVRLRSIKMDDKTVNVGQDSPTSR